MLYSIEEFCSFLFQHSFFNLKMVFLSLFLFQVALFPFFSNKQFDFMSFSAFLVYYYYYMPQASLQTRHLVLNLSSY